MSHSVSVMASVVAGLMLSSLTVSNLSMATEPDLAAQAVDSKTLDVNFPDVQAQIEADLKYQQTQGFEEIDAQFGDPNIAKEPMPDQVHAQTNLSTTTQSPQQTQPAPQALPQMQSAPAPTPVQDNSSLQPIAMVQMADGKVYPVYVADGQNFDGNLANAPDNAVAYLAVPAHDLSKQGVVMPLAEGQATLAPKVTSNQPAVKTITNTPKSVQSTDPAYSPKVKVYGNKTPTFIGSRSEAQNYINDLRESGAYSYNVNAPSYDGGYGYYYQYGSGYYDPYYAYPNNYGYYQDTNGQWHLINGFRFDPSINNYVPVYQDYGSCVGKDCPVIVAPGYPNAGLPIPNPNPPQGPATGQPPAWGPPPSYNQGQVDPGFTHPGYQPRPPRPAYPHQPPARPVRPDPVDPGFTHPFG